MLKKILFQSEVKNEKNIGIERRQIQFEYLLLNSMAILLEYNQAYIAKILSIISKIMFLTAVSNTDEKMYIGQDAYEEHLPLQVASKSFESVWGPVQMTYQSKPNEAVKMIFHSKWKYSTKEQSKQ